MHGERSDQSLGGLKLDHISGTYLPITYLNTVSYTVGYVCSGC